MDRSTLVDCKPFHQADSFKDRSLVFNDNSHFWEGISAICEKIRIDLPVFVHRQGFEDSNSFPAIGGAVGVGAQRDFEDHRVSVFYGRFIRLARLVLGQIVYGVCLSCLMVSLNKEEVQVQVVEPVDWVKVAVSAGLGG